jgi:hypothetical protein
MRHPADANGLQAKHIVLVRAQEIAVYTTLLVVLLWLLPALILAPILAWTMLRKTPAKPADTAEAAALKQGVQP